MGHRRQTMCCCGGCSVKARARFFDPDVGDFVSPPSEPDSSGSSTLTALFKIDGELCTGEIHKGDVFASVSLVTVVGAPQPRTVDCGQQIEITLHDRFYSTTSSQWVLTHADLDYGCKDDFEHITFGSASYPFTMCPGGCVGGCAIELTVYLKKVDAAIVDPEPSGEFDEPSDCDPLLSGLDSPLPVPVRLFPSWGGYGGPGRFSSQAQQCVDLGIDSFFTDMSLDTEVFGPDGGGTVFYSGPVSSDWVWWCRYRAEWYSDPIVCPQFGDDQYSVRLLVSIDADVAWMLQPTGDRICAIGRRWQGFVQVRATTPYGLCMKIAGADRSYEQNWLWGGTWCEGPPPSRASLYRAMSTHLSGTTYTIDNTFDSSLLITGMNFYDGG
jgi:hypothetical protein